MMEDIRLFIDDFHKPIFAMLLIIQLILLYNLFQTPYVNIDSGWLAEPAYNYAQSYEMVWKTWGGYLGLDQAVYVYPPLFFEYEGIFIAIFGFSFDSVLAFNALTVICSLIILFIIAKDLYGKSASIIAPMLLTGSFLFWFHALTHNRPEVLVGIFILISTYFLEAYYREKKSSFIYMAVLMSVVASLTHWLGLIMFAAIMLVELGNGFYKSAIKGLFLFGITYLIGFITYAGIKPIEFIQTQLDFGFGGGYGIGKAISDEATRYYWLITTNGGVGLIEFGLLALVVCIAFKERITKGIIKGNSTIAFVLLLYLVAFIVIPKKTIAYFDALMPLVALYLAGKFNTKEYGKIIYIIAFLAICASITALLIYQNKIIHTYNFREQSAYVSNLKLENVAAMPSLFYVYKNNMVSTTALTYREKSGEDLVTMLKDQNIKYLILDPINDLPYMTDGMKLVLNKSKSLVSICTIDGKTRYAYNDVCDSNPYRWEIYEIG